MEDTDEATRTSSSLEAIAPTPYSSMPFYGHTVVYSAISELCDRV